MTRWLVRAYGVLLHLYPPSLRRQFGGEMERCVRDVLERRGAAAVPRLIADTLVSLVREWRRVLPPARTGGIGRDAAYAVRVLSRSPRFTITAVVTLALGIGANAAIFTLADATLLRPVRVADPERLVSYAGSLSYPDYRALAEELGGVFDGLLASSGSGRLSARIDGHTEIVTPSFVSGNYFNVLGVRAALGRTLGGSDDRDGTAIAGVLGYDWFRSRFGGDPSVIGRTIWISGQPVTIVGVAQHGFRGTSLFGNPTLFVPLAATPILRRGFFSRPDVLLNGDFLFLAATGRLRPGVHADAAGAALTAALAARHPEREGRPADAARLVPLTARALGGDNADAVRRFVWMLIAVVAITMLIACANVANLQLARGAAREREIAVRLAIGASRARIIRQLLIESVLLALAGSAAGAYVTAMAISLLSGFQLPGGIDISNLRLSIGGPTLLFLCLLALATSMLFGIAPALRASARSPLDAVRGGSRAVTPGGGLRGALVGTQLALSVLLLAGSGLFIQSLNRALRAPLGFTVEHAATASANLEAARYDAARARQYYEHTIERLEQIPGIRHAAWSTVIPITGASMWNVEVEQEDGRTASATFRVTDVTRDYFAAAGTRILAGRPFIRDDDPSHPRVAIVNEVVARRYWNGSALGHRLRVGTGEWATIVGVAENTHAESLVEKPEPFAYLPIPQRETARLDAVTVFVRTEGDAATVVPMVIAALKEIAPEVPTYAAGTFADQIRELVMPMRMGAALFTAFGALALILSMVGIYGVAALAAAQRTREIGIRIALGAQRVAIVALVLRGGATSIAAGLAAGLAAAALLGRLVSAFLFDVAPRDPATLVGAASILATLAVIATYLPARRAARLDPVTTLRIE